MFPLLVALALLAACAPTDDKADDNAEDADGDGVSAPVDCDDFNSIVHPYMDESCDGVDNDCDGLVDDEDDDCTDTIAAFVDGDGDGFGDGGSSVAACELGAGQVDNGDDCDDADAGVSPDAAERCDDAGVDEDCDGLVDDEDGDVEGTREWYADEDGDGHGDASRKVDACDLPADASEDGLDCDDADPDVGPHAQEVCDDADVDEDCDGLADDEDEASGLATWFLDADGDGWGTDASTAAACEPPEGYAAGADDCDDADGSVNPGAEERCDGGNVDEDCDGLVNDADASPADGDRFYADADGDGYGDAAAAIVACSRPAGTVPNDDDCDDANGEVNPGADEICDALDADEDCDGLAEEDDPGALGTTSFYDDADGDGYGVEGAAVEACDGGAGLVSTTGDCDDGDAAIHPEALEVCGDAVDDNCDDWIPDCGPSGDEGVAAVAYAEMYGVDASGGLSQGNGLWRAGDMDGDGRDDVIVGASTGDGSAAGAGVAYVVYGQAEGSFPATAADVVLTGGAADDAFGHFVYGGGDLSGDGALDVLVGASGEDTRATGGGAIYLFPGPLPDEAEWRDAATTFYGASSSDNLGTSFAVGDVDGDGVLDVHGGGDGGAWTWFGPFTTSTVSTAAADLELTITASYAAYAKAASAVGDLDGDGLGEVVQAGYVHEFSWSNPFEQYSTAYVVAGGTTGTVEVTTDADAMLEADDLDNFGLVMSTGADLDGDGNVDLAITATTASTRSTSYVGEVYVFTGGIPASGAPEDVASIVLSGDERYQYFGYSTDMMGDFDGDGQADFLVGAAGDDGASSDAGATYLFYGPLAGRLDSGDAGASWTGDISGDYLGGSVISAGDTNADGLEDLVLGATGRDGGGADAGGVYFLLGG